MASRTALKAIDCVLCNKRTKQRDRRSVNSDIRNFLRKCFMLDVQEDTIICNKCRHKYYSEKEKLNASRISNAVEGDDEFRPSVTKVSKQTESSPPSIQFPIATLAKTHAYCVICKRPGPKLMVINSNARFQLFLRNNLLCPSGSRCCPVHIDGSNFTEEALKACKFTSETSFVNRSTLWDLLQRTRQAVLKTQNTRLDFENPDSLSDMDYITLTGLTKVDFADLCSFANDIQNTSVRSKRMSVAIFLVKHRSGMSNKLMSTIFNISKSSIRRAIASVRQALYRSFVPLHLGPEHITRQQVINEHTRPLANELFGNLIDPPVILVLDGTYIYIQKSNNFHFQRRSFSVVKGRPLVKLMIIVTTTGYFFSVDGPYLADSKNNDASILNHMMIRDADGIKNWLQDNDLFIVDRGFRDSVDFLQNIGIETKMPAFLTKGKKQMDTDEANDTRLVTKLRWVVESANARMKQWKYFAQVLPTTQIPYIGESARIIAAICNRYKKALSSGDHESDMCLAAKMKYLSSQINELKQKVEENHWDKRTVIWDNIDENHDYLVDFPELSEDQIRNITCGVYQLKLSKSYSQEHMEGNYDIQVHKQDRGLLRCKLQSRHVSSRAYLLWIRYDAGDVNAWYCKCRAGARVVGTCSHIASVLWYLGYARHQEMTNLGVKDWAMYVKDAAEIPALIDASDSEDSVTSSVIEE